MTDDTLDSKKRLPAQYRHTPFLDLLVDAAYNYRKAKNESDHFEVNRAARSSITASCLNIECFANGLIDALNAPSRLKDEIDKLPPLAKIDLALGFNGKPALDRGSAVVQKISELIRLRNDHVHPKVVTTDADMHPSEEDSGSVIFPFTVVVKFWPTLKIPKYSVLWDFYSSKAALVAISDFYKHVIVEALQGSDELVTRTLLPRFEFSNVLMPAIFDEYKAELDSLASDGIDFPFLKL